VTDPRLTRYAALVCDYSLELRAGERLYVLSPSIAEPLALAIAREAFRRGADPALHIVPPEAEERVQRDGSDVQLAHPDPLLLAGMETADAVLAINAPTNTRSLSSLPAGRTKARTESRRAFQDIYRERFLKANGRWLLCEFPTSAGAQQAEMGTAAFERFVYASCFLDEPDPQAEWRALAERQRRLVERLRVAREIRARAPGTDLTLSVEGCGWESSCGLRNLPDGEVFTSPHAPSVEGEIAFGLPQIREGRRYEGVRLRFEGGRVVDASAESGEDALHALLDLDDGSRSLGELAIGTNVWIQHPTGLTIFDEKIGGTFHVALGAGFPHLGGPDTNRSVLHWDLVCDLREGGSIEADGEAVVRDGRLLV
jgi:aminopeptidase